VGTEQAALERLKARTRETWMAGDFGRVAEYSAKEAQAFVDRLGVRQGMKVLDVACGSGNLAIPAARAGANVTGLDIAPNLLEQARARARAEGLNARFDQGDAEQLPYADGEFDLVMTMFGAMFAPRPEVAASELIRVCRPGGTIAMANWTPASFAAKMFALGAEFIPPPEGVPPPVLWGDAKVARKRLANGTSEVRTTLTPIGLEFPFGPAQVTEFFREYFGPVRMAFERLDPDSRDRYAEALEKLWRDHNVRSGGGTLVPTEYLEVIATRA
jgi:SAM-dependent methyltransferase